MDTVKDVFELPLDEISPRIACLRKYHREILSGLARGKCDKEIAKELAVTVGALRIRIAAACDRAGVGNRAQLLAMFSIWEYAQKR